MENCHCCNQRPAARESVTHMVPFQKMCQPCIDERYPETTREPGVTLTRDLFYPPNGRELGPEGESRTD